MKDPILKILGTKKGNEYKNRYPFLNDKCIHKWIRGLMAQNKSSKLFSSRRLSVYVNRMNQFLDFCGDEITPTDLIKEKYYDDLKMPIEREKISRSRVYDFYEYLLNEGKAERTANSYCGSIRGFYSHNDVPITKLHLKKGELKRPKAHMTKELIRKALLNTLRPRDRLIILIMASSGMSIYDVLDMRYKHIKGMLERDEIPYKLYFKRVKNTNKYITFLSTETCLLMKQFLEDRGDMGDEDPLFINRYKKKLKYRSVARVLRRVSKKTLDNNSLNTKAFRRFFSTQMKLGGVPPEWVEFMMGHTTGVSIDYFDKPELREAYLNAMERVTINTKVVEKHSSEEMKELKEKMADYEKKLKVLKYEIIRNPPDRKMTMKEYHELRDIIKSI